ncbi:MAG TPA: tetratricopeptide repeat protein [Methylomirabilota bacterium]|jgi:tetratricopeptide (TPR) repeat protein
MTRASFRLPPRTLALAIAAAAFTAFASALPAGFVEWDDHYNFLNNPHYRGLGLAQLRWMLTSAWSGHWTPLTWLTLSADFTVWGMDPFGYHFTSLVLHAATAGVFFVVAARLLASAQPETAPGAIRAGAAVAALFFALHPLRAESVAWISERRDVLSGLLYVLTVLTYLRAAETAGAARRRWLALSVAVYALAMLSKAIVMSLPVVLLVLDAYPLRRLAGRWRQRLLEKLPYAALGAAGAVVAARVAIGFESRAEYPLWARPAAFGYNLVFYLEKTVLPQGLSPLYELPARWEISDSRLLVGLTLSLVATVALIAARRRWPAGLAAWTAYAITVAPVGGLAVHNGPQIAADRYTYLACMGVAVLAGGAWSLALARHLLAPRLRRTAGAAVAVALLGLGVLSWQQAAIWHDSVTLWAHATSVDPTCARCQNRLGASLHAAGLSSAGVIPLQRAVALRPDIPNFRGDLGQVLVWLNRPAEAVPQLERAVEAFPDNAALQSALGAALTQAGRPDEARRRLETALRNRPDDVGALTQMGFALVATAQPAAAVPYFERAISQAPRAVAARYGLTRAVVALGDHARAERELAALRALDPRAAALAEGARR